VRVSLATQLNSTQLNSTRRRVEFSCVAINGPLSAQFKPGRAAGPTAVETDASAKNLFSASFSKYRVYKFGNRQTDGQTDGQFENILSPPARLA